jgi:hypothetical protein
MASDAAIEALTSWTLKQDVTRVVLERLGVEMAPARRLSPRTTAKAPDLVLSSESGDLIVAGKPVTGKLVLEAVSAALDQCLGGAEQVFLLSAGDDPSRVIAKVMLQVPHAVRARQHVFTEAHLDALVDVYLPHDPLARPLAEIERDNAEAQARFIESVTCYSAEEVAALAGHEATNRSATATRWKAQRAIFGVRRLGRDRYPAFQFQDGRPRKIIGKTLHALPEGMSPWQVALWFANPNGWLDGSAPMDRLGDETALLAAAAREGDDWIG